MHRCRICRDDLTRFELLEPLLAASSLEGVRRTMQRCRDYANGSHPFEPGASPFVADPPAAKALAAALAARPSLSAAEAVGAAREASHAASLKKRESFEARMRKRARGEGRDEDYYTQQGLQLPTTADVAAAKEMKRDAQVTWWRERFGRHCRELYVDGSCPWELDPRGCGFLHPSDLDLRAEPAPSAAADADRWCG